MSSKPNLPLQNVLNESDEVDLPSVSPEKLCEIIVCYRYLGLMEKESIQAMEELAKRRAAGDEFNFELRIEALMSDLPIINLDINKMLKSFKAIQ